ncbi:MAG: CoA pyrophosphatase [Bacteroidota bacterium]
MMYSVDSTFIQQLQRSMSQPLPGPEAHYKMAHVGRNLAPKVPSNARIACVLQLLYPVDRDWHIVLIERQSSNRNDRHSGQISFPGGGYEASDETLVNGALREAWEEVGVEPKKVSVLGALTELYIPVSNFLVHPFLGYTTERPDFRRQESEVRSILEVPLSWLQNPESVQKTDLPINKQLVLKDVPHFNVKGHIVWGATAMMLSELLEIAQRKPEENTD